MFQIVALRISRESNKIQINNYDEMDCSGRNQRVAGLGNIISRGVQLAPPPIIQLRALLVASHK